MGGQTREPEKGLVLSMKNKLPPWGLAAGWPRFRNTGAFRGNRLTSALRGAGFKENSLLATAVTAKHGPAAAGVLPVLLLRDLGAVQGAECPTGDGSKKYNPFSREIAEFNTTQGKRANTLRYRFSSWGRVATLRTGKASLLCSHSVNGTFQWWANLLRGRAVLTFPEGW